MAKGKGEGEAKAKAACAAAAGGAMRTGAAAGATRADALSEAFYAAREAELATRVGRRRFEHSLGVAETAAGLARVYGADERLARLAGLLHDWDKGYDDEGIRARVAELGLTEGLEGFLDMPHLLHGPTAAAALARDFPGLPAELLRAIRLHTTGAVGMTDLDMVVFTADAIEPGRDYPGLADLRSLVGAATLEELFLSTYQNVFENLVQRRKRVHPATTEVWNHYVMRARQRAAGEALKKGKK